MKREVLFKYYIENKHTGAIHKKVYSLSQIEESGLKALFDVENYTIIATCQFTGLLAVDERKVFESDRVKIAYGKGDMAGVRVRDGVVIFEDGCFYVKINNSQVKIPFSIIVSISITGNIFDK